MRRQLLHALSPIWCAFFFFGLLWEAAALAAPPAGYTAEGRPFWRVVPEYRTRDEKMGIVDRTTGAYLQSDTAQRLVNVIDPSGRIGLQAQGKEIVYGIDLDGHILVNTRAMGRQKAPKPHPTLVGGADPAVLAAGTLELRDGRLFKITNSSGHFQPNEQSLSAAKAAFSQLPATAFHPAFSGYDFRPEERPRAGGPGPNDPPDVGGVSMDMKISRGSFTKPQDGGLKKLRDEAGSARTAQDKNHQQSGE